MKKVPTVFQRDPDDRRRLLPVVTPGCEWVLDGVGTPTRKFDGTCVQFDGIEWWARREVKPSNPSPPGWLLVEQDETTGKMVGWEPMAQSGFVSLLNEALAIEKNPPLLEPGTYELCGPKINGNPEGFSRHILVTHGSQHLVDVPRDFEGLRAWLADAQFEGIVWWSNIMDPDAPMAKLKRRDFHG